MLRPSSLPRAAAVVTAGAIALLVAVLGLVPAASAAAGPGGLVGTGPSASARSRVVADEEQPLVPRIHSITPDVVPEHGPVVIRGTVTNVSDKKWTAINVHGFMGSDPITTTADLDQAADVPLDADVGHRITVPGTFASIQVLRPGQTKSFEVRLPQRTLPVTSPGVYWFGVHVLGDDGDGGARVAVGRDRTFLAYVPDSARPSGEQEDTALVVPVRSGVTRGADGSVIDPDAWGRSLRSGALHDVLRLGRAAGGRPLTWTVDPAVPDVVRRLARGNLARTLDATPPADGTDDPSASPSADAADSTDSTDSAASGAAGTAPAAGTQRVSRRWLRAIHGLLGADTGQVLGLPYGDLAVESAASFDRPLLRESFRRSGASLRRWGLSAGSVVAPPSGRTSAATLAATPRSAPVILDDTGVRGRASTFSRVDGHPVVFSSPATATGGPGPVSPHSSLALRQRILAEAALRLLDGGQPLVVQLPVGLGHRVHRSFFTGLDVPWLHLTTLGAAGAVTTPLDASRLRVPEAAQPGLGARLYQTADQVLENGRTLQSVLADHPSLQRRLFEEVSGNASYAAEREPFLAESRMRVISAWVDDNLDAIAIAAPESVTLASASGRFSAIVSNELDVPVTVQVRAVSDPDMKITGGDEVQVAPHARTSVLLNASTHQRGVHNVTLELVTADGRQVGAVSRFPMRAEQVSRLIWVIIGAGVALLFAAIVVRLTRRVLRARAARRTAS